MRRVAHAVFSVDTKDAEYLLSGVKRKVPEGVRIGTKKLAEKAAKIYVESAKASGIQKWTGQLFAQTKAHKMGKNEYVVLMPEQGMMLDQMRTHWVYLKKGRSITKWAESKPEKPGLKSGKLLVRPHPFIYRAHQRIGRHITIVFNETKKKFKEVKR